MSAHMNDTIKKAVPAQTVQFSVEKTRHAPLSKSATSSELKKKEAREEKELLKPRAIPTEFEDIFSDAEKEDDGSETAEEVVGIEEVFKTKAEMINEDFHNETGEGMEENYEAKRAKRLKKAAVVIGIICGAVILSAVTVAAIILL